MPSTLNSPPYIVDGKTDAERYLEGCLDGTYVVGRRIKRLAEIILPQIRDGYKGWVYSESHALRPVQFIEQFCKFTDGRLKGQPFILEPYERMIIELAFGFVDENGYRRFREVIVEIARKNGKTQLCAALNIFMLMADGENGAEVYNCATTSSQASLCYGATNNMLSLNKTLSKRIRRGKVQKRDMTGLNYDATASYLCTISAGGNGNLDGLNTHFAVYDELGACKDGGATYDLISESMSATSRTQPLVFIISTENFVRYDIWDERKEFAYGWLDGTIEDDRLLPILYEIDSLADIEDPVNGWPKANPGLGTVKSASYLEERIKKANQSPARKPSMLTKDFNWIANEYTSFLTREECHNPETFTINRETDRYCVVGFDLADRGDLNAAVALFMRPGDERIYELSMFWIAEEQVEINTKSLKERDRVPYRLWAANDWLRIVPGDKVNQRVVIDWIKELADEYGLYTRWCGYDSWHVDDWAERELEMMIGKSNFESIPQWPKNISPTMKEHKIDLAAHRVINPSPVTEFCRANIQAKIDANDNYFPQKKGLKPNLRIDGYMAEIFAMQELRKHEDEYKMLIGWDQS